MNVFKMSPNAMAAIMIALQNSLFHETDILPVLEGFEWIIDEDGKLTVINPPVLNLNTEDSTEVEY